MAIAASEGTSHAEQMFEQALAELDQSFSERRIVSATANV